VQLAHLEQVRWVVLAIIPVLKPGYTSILYRSVQRALGRSIAAARWTAIVRRFR